MLTSCLFLFFSQQLVSNQRMNTNYSRIYLSLITIVKYVRWNTGAINILLFLSYLGLPYGCSQHQLQTQVQKGLLAQLETITLRRNSMSPSTVEQFLFVKSSKNML